MQKAIVPMFVILGVALFALLVMAANQSDIVHVGRTVAMTATSADVAPFVEDMVKVASWSPWDERDPDIRKRFSARSTGVGAWYAWDGGKAGRGKQRITAVEPGKVQHHLRFYEPFAAEAASTLTYTSSGELLQVTWSYEREATLGMKLMGLFRNMDSVVGPDLERGLARLQLMVERAAMERLDGGETTTVKAELMGS